MDLALAIGGCTLAELEERMTEREFYLWQIYASQFYLPARREQLQGALTSYMIARTMGNAKANAKLEDFVIGQPSTPDMDAEEGIAMIGAVTSARVYRLGQGRKTSNGG